MPLTLQGNPHMQALADEHRSWLTVFDPKYLANWEKLLNAFDEAAMTEAEVRRRLQSYGITVQPNEDLSGAKQQPDFLCSKSGKNFYVEVTCIGIEQVVEETGLPYPAEPGARNYSMLNNSFWSACKRKARQCGDSSYPTLVAVGTFHTSASMLCVDKAKVEMLLTGETQLAWNIDVQTGGQVSETYLQTSLYSAAFLKPDAKTEVGFARSSVSGLLLCGCGVVPPNLLGVLHPNPARPFDPFLLPDVEFGQVEIDRASKQLRVHWPRENEAPVKRTL